MVKREEISTGTLVSVHYASFSTCLLVSIDEFASVREIYREQTRERNKTSPTLNDHGSNGIENIATHPCEIQTRLLHDPGER